MRKDIGLLLTKNYCVDENLQGPVTLKETPTAGSQSYKEWKYGKEK